jgi:hypothetical protein
MRSVDVATSLSFLSDSTRAKKTNAGRPNDRRPAHFTFSRYISEHGSDHNLLADAQTVANVPTTSAALREAESRSRGEKSETAAPQKMVRLCFQGIRI